MKKNTYNPTFADSSARRVMRSTYYDSAQKNTSEETLTNYLYRLLWGDEKSKPNEGIELTDRDTQELPPQEQADMLKISRIVGRAITTINLPSNERQISENDGALTPGIIQNLCDKANMENLTVVTPEINGINNAPTNRRQITTIIAGLSKTGKLDQITEIDNNAMLTYPQKVKDAIKKASSGSAITKFIGLGLILPVSNAQNHTSTFNIQLALYNRTKRQARLIFKNLELITNYLNQNLEQRLEFKTHPAVEELPNEPIKPRSNKNQHVNSAVREQLDIVKNIAGLINQMRDSESTYQNTSEILNQIETNQNLFNRYAGEISNKITNQRIKTKIADAGLRTALTDLRAQAANDLKSKQHYNDKKKPEDSILLEINQLIKNKEADYLVILSSQGKTKTVTYVKTEEITKNTDRLRKLLARSTSPFIRFVSREQLAVLMTAPNFTDPRINAQAMLSLLDKVRKSSKKPLDLVSAVRHTLEKTGLEPTEVPKQVRLFNNAFQTNLDNIPKQQQYGISTEEIKRLALALSPFTKKTNLAKQITSYDSDDEARLNNSDISTAPLSLFPIEPNKSELKALESRVNQLTSEVQLTKDFKKVNEKIDRLKSDIKAFEGKYNTIQTDWNTRLGHVLSALELRAPKNKSTGSRKTNTHETSASTPANIQRIVSVGQTDDTQVVSHSSETGQNTTQQINNPVIEVSHNVSWAEIKVIPSHKKDPNTKETTMKSYQERQQRKDSKKIIAKVVDLFNQLKSTPSEKNYNISSNIRKQTFKIQGFFENYRNEILKGITNQQLKHEIETGGFENVLNKSKEFGPMNRQKEKTFIQVTTQQTADDKKLSVNMTNKVKTRSQISKPNTNKQNTLSPLDPDNASSANTTNESFSLTGSLDSRSQSLGTTPPSSPQPVTRTEETTTVATDAIPPKKDHFADQARGKNKQLIIEHFEKIQELAGQIKSFGITLTVEKHKKIVCKLGEYTIEQMKAFVENPGTQAFSKFANNIEGYSTYVEGELSKEPGLWANFLRPIVNAMLSLINNIRVLCGAKGYGLYQSTSDIWKEKGFGKELRDTCGVNGYLLYVNNLHNVATSEEEERNKDEKRGPQKPK